MATSFIEFLRILSSPGLRLENLSLWGSYNTWCESSDMLFRGFNLAYFTEIIYANCNVSYQRQVENAWV